MEKKKISYERKVMHKIIVYMIIFLIALIIMIIIDFSSASIQIKMTITIISFLWGLFISIFGLFEILRQGQMINNIKKRN